MNRTILIVIIFGALCFGLLFYVFYSELSKTSQSIEIKKQTTDPGYQQQQRPLNNLDVELLNQDIENAKVIYNKPYPFSWE